jgi:hypothetical protein
MYLPQLWFFSTQRNKPFKLSVNKQEAQLSHFDIWLYNGSNQTKHKQEEEIHLSSSI